MYLLLAEKLKEQSLVYSVNQIGCAQLTSQKTRPLNHD